MKKNLLKEHNKANIKNKISLKRNKGEKSARLCSLVDAFTPLISGAIVVFNNPGGVCQSKDRHVDNVMEGQGHQTLLYLIIVSELYKR